MRIDTHVHVLDHVKKSIPCVHKVRTRGSLCLKNLCMCMYSHMHAYAWIRSQGSLWHIQFFFTCIYLHMHAYCMLHVWTNHGAGQDRCMEGKHHSAVVWAWYGDRAETGQGGINKHIYARMTMHAWARMTTYTLARITTHTCAQIMMHTCTNEDTVHPWQNILSGEYQCMTACTAWHACKGQSNTSTRTGHQKLRLSQAYTYICM